MKKPLSEIAKALNETGPDRYLLNAPTGETVSADQMKLMGGNPSQADVILIRDDGWALGIQGQMMRLAWKLFEEQWVGIWFSGMPGPSPVRADQLQLVDQLQADLEGLNDPPTLIELERVDDEWIAFAVWGPGQEIIGAASPNLLAALKMCTERLVAAEPDPDTN